MFNKKTSNLLFVGSNGNQVDEHEHLFRKLRNVRYANVETMLKKLTKQSQSETTPISQSNIQELFSKLQLSQIEKSKNSFIEPKLINHGVIYKMQKNNDFTERIEKCKSYERMKASETLRLNQMRSSILLIQPEISPALSSKKKPFGARLSFMEQFSLPYLLNQDTPTKSPLKQSTKSPLNLVMTKIGNQLNENKTTYLNGVLVKNLQIMTERRHKANSLQGEKIKLMISLTPRIRGSQQYLQL